MLREFNNGTTTDDDDDDEGDFECSGGSGGPSNIGLDDFEDNEMDGGVHNNSISSKDVSGSGAAARRHQLSMGKFY